MDDPHKQERLERLSAAILMGLEGFKESLCEDDLEAFIRLLTLDACNVLETPRIEDITQLEKGRDYLCFFHSGPNELPVYGSCKEYNGVNLIDYGINSYHPGQLDRIYGPLPKYKLRD